MSILTGILTLALLFGNALAQEGEGGGAPAPCSSPECRQFDFWIGDWTVEANGKTAGTSRITPILGGCVLMEEWQSGSGFEGKSFNRYDGATGTWEQFWVDNRGGVLKLSGGYADGKMTMSGASIARGEPALNRITWHNNADGTVRQVWEQSTDDGESWKTVFDGLYRRAAE